MKPKDQSTRQLDKVVGRQTTLFGLPVNAKPKNKISSKKKLDPLSTGIDSDLAASSEHQSSLETQVDDSRFEDSAAEETQTNDSQPSFIETQLVDEPKDILRDSPMLDTIMV